MSDRYNEGIHNLRTWLEAAGIEYEEDSYRGSIEEAAERIGPDEGLEQLFNNLPPISFEGEIGSSTLRAIHETGENIQGTLNIVVSGSDIDFEFGEDLFSLRMGESKKIASDTRWLEERLGFERKRVRTGFCES